MALVIMVGVLLYFRIYLMDWSRTRGFREQLIIFNAFLDFLDLRYPTPNRDTKIPLEVT